MTMKHCPKCVITVQFVNQYPSALLALNQLRRRFWLRHATTSRIPMPWWASPYCVKESLLGFLQKRIYWLASCWQRGWKQAVWQIIDGRIDTEDSRFCTDTSTRQGQVVSKLARPMESKLCDWWGVYEVSHLIMNSNGLDLYIYLKIPKALEIKPIIHLHWWL